MMNPRPKTWREHCPKCRGNIYLDSDEHGWFEHCLQCGYTRDLEVIVASNSDRLMAANKLVNLDLDDELQETERKSSWAEQNSSARSSSFSNK